MKSKGLVIVVALLIAISLALPTAAYAGRGGYGWYALGGLATGLLLGTAIARPYYYPPAPVYVYSAPPPVVYTYTAPRTVYVPNQAYAYPDPTYTPPPARPRPPGQWVEVPAQWVGDRWVPAHKAWAVTP
jgi:hypothetical protein